MAVHDSLVVKPGERSELTVYPKAGQWAANVDSFLLGDFERELLGETIHGNATCGQHFTQLIALSINVLGGSLGLNGSTGKAVLKLGVGVEVEDAEVAGLYEPEVVALKVHLDTLAAWAGATPFKTRHAQANDGGQAIRLSARSEELVHSYSDSLECGVSASTDIRDERASLVGRSLQTPHLASSLTSHTRY